MVFRSVRTDNGRALLDMFEVLKRSAQASGITVQILAALDHDGLCGAKILDSVLRQQGVLLSVSPIRSNADIVEYFRKLDSSFEVKYIVFVNCGGGVDLKRLIEHSHAPQDMHCYVIDSHRPLLLDNLSKRLTRVTVLDDKPVYQEETRIPIDEDEEEESDGGESEAEDEKENVWGDNGEIIEVANTKAAERRKRRMLRQDRRRGKKSRINEYYAGTYYAMPAAMSLFRMARQAGRPSQDLLWLAAISLTSYFEHGLISELEYNRLAYEELKDSLDEAQAGSDSFSETLTKGVSADAAEGSDEEADEATSKPSQPSRRPVPRSLLLAKAPLRFEQDIRLTLYKHWTLEESMQHSSYFYGALELHRDKGIRNLKGFFAESGIPPSEYKQMYSGVDVDIKKTLGQKFQMHGKAYGLTESRMFIQQFVRDVGHLGEGTEALLLREMSSCDAVHVLTGLFSVGHPTLATLRTDLLPKTDNGMRDTATIGELERQWMVENFHRAWDAASCMEPSLLRDGIKEAIKVAKEIQTLARLIRDTKSMKGNRMFLYCKIEQPPVVLRHPTVIRKFAVWLTQVMFSYRPGKNGGELREQQPMLVMVKDLVRDTYLCVGVSASHLGKEDEFPSLFRSVLRRDRSLRYRYDFLDRSCIEVASEDFTRFWDVLQQTYQLKETGSP